MSIICPEWGADVKEPGSIEYLRRRGKEPLLEAVGVEQSVLKPRRFIIVCGLSGTNTMMVRWYAANVVDARLTFRKWLSEPWQTMKTDLAGNGVENGLDFKPSQVSWFNIIEDLR